MKKIVLTSYGLNMESGQVLIKQIFENHDAVYIGASAGFHQFDAAPHATDSIDSHHFIPV